jgi:hypothetical protein
MILLKNCSFGIEQQSPAHSLDESINQSNGTQFGKRRIIQMKLIHDSRGHNLCKAYNKVFARPYNRNTTIVVMQHHCD